MNDPNTYTMKQKDRVGIECPPEIFANQYFLKALSGAYVPDKADKLVLVYKISDTEERHGSFDLKEVVHREKKMGCMFKLISQMSDALSEAQSREVTGTKKRRRKKDSSSTSSTSLVSSSLDTVAAKSPSRMTKRKRRKARGAQM